MHTTPGSLNPRLSIPSLDKYTWFDWSKCLFQVVRLREVFPHGAGFVLVFDYMLSDLGAVIRNSETPLTEVCMPAVLSLRYTRHIVTEVYQAYCH